MNEKLKEKILKLIQDRPLNYGQCCQSKAYKLLKDEVLAATPKLNEEYSFKTRFFWILNDIVDFPKCCICGQPVLQNVVTVQNGYNKYKSWEDSDLQHITCTNKNCRIKKRLESQRRTCIEKYGVDNVWKSQKIKNKITQTCLKRYGMTRGGNTTKGRELAKQTWLKKYGTTSPLKNKDILAKMQNTCLKKYGYASFTKTKEYHDLNVKNHLQIFIEKILTYDDPEITFPEIHNEIKKFQSTYDFWNTKLHMHCKKCSNDFLGYPNQNNYAKYKTYSSCQICHPSYASSIYEKQIADFLNQLDPNLSITLNSRKIISPFELDIYCASKKLAFEFDGIYWHSNAVDDIEDNYHLNKTQLCEEKGIQLIHIFENEWLQKQDIVKSRIKNLIGIYDNLVYARKCKIKIVDSNLSKDFLEKNHLQGNINSKIRLGLFLNDDLISLMTFGKCRFDKKHEWELLRFCNKLGYCVPGAASKLLYYFEDKYSPKNLISYADRRWSQGKLYNALGFKLSHISPPNYWYIINGKLESRIKYQKHKLSNILESFDESKSEVQNMKDNKFYRIFDCGNLVFEKNKREMRINEVK